MKIIQTLLESARENNQTKHWFSCFFILLTTCFFVGSSNILFGAWPGKGSKYDWPQWRGPNRDGISKETGLLKNWPKAGPKVLWRIPFGDGFSGISVSQGRAYTMYAKRKDEYVVCLDASTGREIWRFRSGDNFSDWQGGNGPRSTPTVDGDLVFVLGAFGKLYALNPINGQKIWGYDLIKEFGSRRPQWGYATSPLVEGGLLLVETGGKAGNSIVAFNKQSGRVVWQALSDIPGYSSPIAITVHGIRQIIFFTGMALVSVSPTNGKLYWKHTWRTDWDVNAATPVFIPNDKVFISSGYGKGAALFQIKVTNNQVRANPIWESRAMKNHFGSSIFYEDHIYGFDNATLKCIEVSSGAEKWKQRGFGKGTLILADGYLIVLSDRGKLALIQATPTGYKEKASAQVLRGKCWTIPTLANGKLYLRNQKEMLCLDFSGSAQL
ncbi:MAG: PQQ-binding-like beta-propeller repeat protein [bacterium]